MDKFNKLCLLPGLILLLFSGQSAMAMTDSQGIQLAHDIGYPHSHNDFSGYNESGYSRSSGRIRSYHYCLRNAYSRCKGQGGSHSECNRQHHVCTYGHTRNWIP